MAKKLTDVTNPLTTQGGNLLDPSDWISRILWVFMFGAVFTVGAKVLTTADKFIPGNITPNDFKTISDSPVMASGPIVY